MPVAIAIALLVLASILFHLLQPVVDDADRVQLGLDRHRADHHSVDLRGRLRRPQPVPGAGRSGAIAHRPGHKAHYEPENARLEKQLTLWTGDRHRRDARARPDRLERICHRARGRRGGRGDRPAMAMGLPLPGPGRRARHRRGRPYDAGQSVRPQSRAIRTAATTSWSRPASCTCRSASRSRWCCAPRTCCTISTCRSSAPRWTWCPASSPISG